jgi:hypothetical protein
MSECRPAKPKRPLWLAQLYSWLYWHPAAAVTLSSGLERSLMSPALRRWLPGDPLYCVPKPSPFEALHDV